MNEELIGEVKKIVADPVQAPQLHDLLHAEARRMVASVNEAALDTSIAFDAEELAKRVELYEGSVATLVQALALVAYFGDPRDQRLIPGVIGSLANAFEPSQGTAVWLDLHRYPAMLAMYGAGLGAVAGKREEALAPIFLTKGVANIHQEREAFVLQLYPGAILDDRLAQRLPGLERHHTPMSDRLHDYLSKPFEALIRDEDLFDHIFDRFEFILGLTMVDLQRGDGSGGWGPIGRFGWRTRDGGIVAEMRQELGDPSTSGLARSGLFGPNGERLGPSAEAYFALINNRHFF